MRAYLSAVFHCHRHRLSDTSNTSVWPSSFWTVTKYLLSLRYFSRTVPFTHSGLPLARCADHTQPINRQAPSHAYALTSFSFPLPGDLVPARDRDAPAVFVGLTHA